MITPADAKNIRAMAIGAHQLAMLKEDSVPVIIPRGKIRNPKKWAVMKGITICPAGSYVRFKRGDEVTEQWLHDELISAGAELVPIG